MISVRLYLDKRGAKKGEPCPIKLMLNHQSSTALLSLGVRVLPSQWDAKTQMVTGSLVNRDAINAYLLERRTTVFNLILRLTSSGDLVGLTVTEAKRKIEAVLSPDVDRSKLLLPRFENYISRCQTKRTGELYASTLKKINDFDSRAESLRFESITKDWLVRFDRWLVETGCVSVNARSIHLRNIRAVFNDAIDNNITTWYPFRRFKIKSEKTAKRAVSVDVLRSLFSFPCEPWQKRYVDCFKLCFCLVGINLIDLLAAAPLPAGSDRLVYRRSKTGKMYDIKVEPEALELIKQYAGREHLVCWGEGRKSYRTFLMQLDRALKMIGNTDESTGKLTPAFPNLSSYVARHSWATIAAELDVPMDVISHALGHGMGNRTTAIYIDFDQRKVDAANRQVLDWVFYGKR